MYQKIFDPDTNKYIPSDSRRGKQVIHKYLDKANNLSGGAESDTADPCNGCGERIVIGDGVSVIIESHGLRVLTNSLTEAESLPGKDSYPDNLPHAVDFGGHHKFSKEEDTQNYRIWKHRHDTIAECNRDIDKLRETSENVKWVLENLDHMLDLENSNQELHEQLETLVHDRQHTTQLHHDGRRTGEREFRHDRPSYTRGRTYSHDDY
jgi:hypothetical protein